MVGDDDRGGKLWPEFGNALASENFERGLEIAFDCQLYLIATPDFGRARRRRDVGPEEGTASGRAARARLWRP